MSKFTLVKEVAAKESIHQEQVYETIKYRRAKDLQRMAKEADLAIDRRRNRAKRSYSGKAPKVRALKTLPPKNYLSLKDAALFVGVSVSALTHYLKTGRIAAQKFNDPNNGLLKWYISKIICKQLKSRKQEGLTVVPSSISGTRKGY